MATTPGGRQIADFGNARLILPSGGMTGVKQSSQGQVAIEDGKLSVFINGVWNTVGLTPVAPTTPALDSNVKVDGAGTGIVNGEYTYKDADNWYGVGAVFMLKRITGYPTPDATVWAICQGANVLYTAPNAPTPWEATWETSSFGIDPAPTVTAVVEPVAPQAAKASATKASPSSTAHKATAQEEKAEQAYSAKQK